MSAIAMRCPYVGEYSRRLTVLVDFFSQYVLSRVHLVCSRRGN